MFMSGILKSYGDQDLNGGVQIGAEPIGGVPELFIEFFEELLFFLGVRVCHDA